MQPTTRAGIALIESGFTPTQAGMLINWMFDTRRIEERLDAGLPYTPITAQEVMNWVKTLVDEGLTEQQALSLDRSRVEIEQQLLKQYRR